MKVLSDPAEVAATHASFRVELTPSGARTAAGSATSATSAAETGSGFGPGGSSVRRGAVIWTGNAAPADPETGGRPPYGARRGTDGSQPAGSATQLLPQVGAGTGASRSVVGPRGPGPSETTQPQPLLHGVRPARGAFDVPEPGEYGDRFDETRFEDARLEDAEFDGGRFDDGFDDGTGGAVTVGARRQAYYPGRRMHLGGVLLPLRVFLGFISVYAGMGKLCDPVYFDGGERGSMVRWLRSLDPWTIASPLHDFAVAHPVGSGLTVAFVQIIIGVLTMCGLWQRLAASVGALLSAALLMTVSWSSGPAYDAPDIIYLAAWSPLVIAGAPVYSLDGRLATDAWRKLGPRADLWDLRRRVLRRGGAIATVVVGLSLLTGSMLGGAVRSSQTATVPEPGDPPTNQLPGSPLPKGPGGRTDSDRPMQGRETQGANSGPEGRRSGGPSASASPGERDGNGESSVPGQRETVQAPQQSVPGGQPPQQSVPGDQGTRGGSASTGGGSGSASGGSSNSGGGGGGSSSGGGGGSSSGGGGGLGGLLG